MWEDVKSLYLTLKTLFSFHITKQDASNTQIILSFKNGKWMHKEPAWVFQSSQVQVLPGSQKLELSF